MRTVLVLGLDSFGETIALTLARKGIDVIAVDRDESVLQRVRDRVAMVFVTDVRERAALQQICDRDIDLAVVSLGAQVEPSVLATLFLREFEVPQVIARAQNDDHEKVLLKVGAHRVVQPVHDSAERLALALASRNLVEFVLVGEDYAIIEIPVPEDYVGRTLTQIALRQRFGVTVIAVKETVEAEAGKFTEQVSAPDPDQKLPADSSLLVIGRTKDLEKFQKR
jgi:trk system potassium uptake protein